MPIYPEHLLAPSPRRRGAHGVAPPSGGIFRRGHGGDGQDVLGVTPSSSPWIAEETSLHAGSGISKNVEPYNRSNNQARHLDAFDQWDALVTREWRYAYRPNALNSYNLSTRDRDELCMWYYKVVDGDNIDRASVALALSYFDLVLAREIVDRTELYLAKLASLSLAIKMNSLAGQGIVITNFVAHSSNGYFMAKDIVCMEKRICEGLGWLLNPPVADSYLNLIKPVLMDMRMIGSSLLSPRRAVSDEDNEDLLDRLVQESKYLCERSVADAYFGGKPPSSIAYAAILEAMYFMCFPEDAIEWFLSLPLNRNVEETNICAGRIRESSCIQGYCPEVTFSHFYGAPVGNEDDEMAKIRVVTPTKEAVPSSVKRARREGIMSPTTIASRHW